MTKKKESMYRISENRSLPMPPEPEIPKPATVPDPENNPDNEPATVPDPET